MLSTVKEPTMDGQRFLTHTFQMVPGAMKIMMGQITTARTTSVYHQRIHCFEMIVVYIYFKIFIGLELSK